MRIHVEADAVPAAFDKATFIRQFRLRSGVCNQVVLSLSGISPPSNQNIENLRGVSRAFALLIFAALLLAWSLGRQS